MSPPFEPVVPYKVVYSQRARNSLCELYSKSKPRGLRLRVTEAAKQIDARLHTYPQFGQPLRDLATEGEAIWIGCVEPLVVRYIIDEALRIVFVVSPFKILANLGS
jgi:hypothetical protein